LYYSFESQIQIIFAGPAPQLHFPVHKLEHLLGGTDRGFFWFIKNSIFIPGDCRHERQLSASHDTDLQSRNLSSGASSIMKRPHPHPFKSIANPSGTSPTDPGTSNPLSANTERRFLFGCRTRSRLFSDSARAALGFVPFIDDGRDGRLQLPGILEVDVPVSWLWLW